MKQNGFTMVELLIGLLLSTLAMTMMLALFKNIVHVGVDSAQGSEHDTKLQNSLLTIQKLVQQAGYGHGAQDDIVLGTFDSNPALLWRFATALDPTTNAGTNYLCQGIGEKIEPNAKTHRLVFLAGTPCSDTADLTTITWQIKQHLASIRSAQTTPLIDYDLVASPNCIPFGIDNSYGGGKRLTLTATITGRTIKPSLCLNNITP